VVVAHLTDEEVDVLVDGVDDVVLRPHLDTLPEPERRAARRAAERSLTARGWLLPEWSAHGGGSSTTPEVTRPGDTMSVADSLASVLQVRRGAPEVVVMHRWVGETTSTRYLFVLSPVVVCEDLSGSGVHTLSVAEATARESLVHEFLVPPDARPSAAGEPTRQLPVGTAATDLVAALGHPVVLAETVTLRAAGEGEARRPQRGERQAALVVALGPAGCYLLERAETPSWQIHPTTPHGVVDRVVAR
jgi:hypothetical protein